MIADDNEFNIYALVSLMKNYMFKIDCVNNGEEAVKKVQEKFNNNKCCPAYLLIFMDVDMPIKDGFEATTEIT